MSLFFKVEASSVTLGPRALVLCGQSFNRRGKGEMVVLAIVPIKIFFSLLCLHFVTLFIHIFHVLEF